MNGLEKMTATTRETKGANVGSETSGRVIIESVIGIPIRREKRRKIKKKK